MLGKKTQIALKNCQVREGCTPNASVLEKLIKKDVPCTNITTKIFSNVNTDWKIQMTVFLILVFPSSKYYD